MNLVILRGVLSSDPRERVLPSGTVVVNWEVTTESDGTRLTVPVAWFDPPRGVAEVTGGDEVAIVGTVRRRFYRTGGATASVTEVRGERMARGSRRRSVERLRDVAADRVEAL